MVQIPAPEVQLINFYSCLFLNLFIFLLARTILVIQLPSDSCMEDKDLKDEYCLEKNVADGLGCFFPGTGIEGEQYKDCKL